MYFDFFTEHGISENLTTPLTVLFFFLTVTPLVSGEKPFGVPFPNLTRLGKIASTSVGSVGLVLMVLGFQPRWQNDELIKDQMPYCYIYTTQSDSDGNYQVRWFVQVEGAFWSTFTENGFVRGEGSSGTVTSNEAIQTEPSAFVLTAGNRYGACSKTTVVQPKRSEEPTVPRCFLSLNKTRAGEGEAYVVEWKVSGAQHAFAYINGSKVELEGRKTFTFDSENYERFHLVGNANGNICEDHGRVLAK